MPVEVPTSAELAEIAAAVVNLDARLTALEQKPDPIPGDVIELHGAGSGDFSRAAAEAHAAGNIPIVVHGTLDMRERVVVDHDLTIIGADDNARIIASNTDLDMWEGQIEQTGGRKCTVKDIALRGHRRLRKFSRSPVFHFPDGVDLYVNKVDGRDISGAAFQVREQKQPILIENSYFQDMYTFFKDRPDKQTLGYPLGLYGDHRTYDKPLDEVPVAVFRNNVTVNCRHPVAVNNAGRLAFLDNRCDNSADSLNAAVIDAHPRQGDNWKAGARFLLALRNTCLSPWYGAGLPGGQCWLGKNDFTACGKDGAVALWNEDTPQGGPIDEFAPWDVHIWDHKWNGTTDPVHLRGLPEEMLDRVSYDVPGELPGVMKMVNRQIAQQLAGR